MYWLIIIVLLFSSCNNNAVTSVNREDLFSLEIGYMEDQIALFQLEGDRGIRRAGFTMRDGLFYIADGSAGKIVRYNSYGDLLFMIYNSETNPAPYSLTSNITEDEQATRWAYTYPLESPSRIAVDSRRHIFVEDRLPQQSQRYDTEINALLDGIILHFDQAGRFVNYLGREGLGGSPFPRIVSLSVTARDELAVICRLPDGWNVYWFNSTGMLLYLVKIDANAVPALPDWPEALAFVETIAAAPDSRNLLLKIDYSRYTYDQSTNTRTGTEPICSVIWTLNIEEGSYLRQLEIPPFEIDENVKVFYSMLGVMRGGKTLLYFPVDTGYSIIFADTYSNEQRRGTIHFSNSELIYNEFYLSTEGILCAMLADNHNVKMVWWRTDRFIGESP